MKIEDEDLRRELQLALKGKDLQSDCAFRLGLRKDSFKEYLFRARVHGIEAVLHRNTPKQYTEEFKLKVVHSVVLKGKSKSGSATKYNLMPRTVYSWVKKYIEGGEELLLSDNRGRKGNMVRKKKPKLEDYLFSSDFNLGKYEIPSDEGIRKPLF